MNQDLNGRKWTDKCIVMTDRWCDIMKLQYLCVPANKMVISFQPEADYSPKKYVDRLYGPFLMFIEIWMVKIGPVDAQL